MPLPAAAILFAILWIAGMLWWNTPLHPAGAVILVIAGGFAGLLLYFAMRVFAASFGGSR
jgi:hypothetical protein